MARKDAYIIIPGNGHVTLYDKKDFRCDLVKDSEMARLS